MGITLVNRLRFDATRVGLNFSKGVAANINEAADEIERLTAAPAQQEPVAWQVALNGGHRQTTAYRETADMWREGGAELIPLYAAPPADAKAEVERAAKEIEEVYRKSDAERTKAADLVKALEVAQKTLKRIGFVGRGSYGDGDREMNVINDALAAWKARDNE